MYTSFEYLNLRQFSLTDYVLEYKLTIQHKYDK